jgi:hypothetical protein
VTDDELKTRVLDLIYRRYSKFHNSFIDPPGVIPMTHGAFCGMEWTKILAQAGCTSGPWSWDYPEEDTDDLFVRHVALGVIRVPREMAMKILVLGELP